jgi:enoyl-CoA hydratase
LPRLIGEGAALQMLFSGRPVDADQALKLGLVSQLSGDAVAAAVELATTFTARPATAVTATKRLVRDAAGCDLHQTIEIEAIAQAAAFHGGEFADTFAAWRTSRRAD